MEKLPGTLSWGGCCLAHSKRQPVHHEQLWPTSARKSNRCGSWRNPLRRSLKRPCSQRSPCTVTRTATQLGYYGRAPNGLKIIENRHLPPQRHLPANWKRLKNGRPTMTSWHGRHVVAPFSKGQDGFCDYLYKVSTKQTPRQSSHSTAPIEGKDNTELDR